MPWGGPAGRGRPPGRAPHDCLPTSRLAYPRGVEVLGEPEWRERTAAHEARVDSATAAHLARRRDHRKHPVEDFLFTYYSFKPAQLRRWHPGVGTGLAGAAGSPHAEWRFYAVDGDVVSVDVEAFTSARGDTLRFVRELLVRTAGRPARFGCFGLHEWAMVYRLDPSDVRHSGWPLRLGALGHRRGGREPPDRLLALRRLPLLHPRGRTAQRADADP